MQKQFKLEQSAFEERAKVIYLESLHDQGVFVVKTSSHLLVVDSADVFLHVAADDHDLPLRAVLGDPSVLGAPLASRLQKRTLVFSVNQHGVDISDCLELLQELLL